MKKLPLLFSFFLVFGFSTAPCCDLPWLAYYGKEASSAELKTYNPIVLDADSDIDIIPLLKEKKVLLAYLNAAEAEERQPWFKIAQEKGILIEENPDWPGSWKVDIRSIFWKNILLNQIIPQLLYKGYTGLFLDQLDVSIDLEDKDPKKYAGMKDAAIDLVKSIHERYPNHPLMLNRAYPLLESLGEDIAFELAETLYTSYDFTTKKYYVRPEKDFKWQLSQLNHARFKFPRLVIFSLDYWDPEDVEMVKHIYSIERSHCMRPYVSTIGLDTITPEPQ